jgi:hypothetical protein
MFKKLRIFKRLSELEKEVASLRKSSITKKVDIETNKINNLQAKYAINRLRETEIEEKHMHEYDLLIFYLDGEKFIYMPKSFKSYPVKSGAVVELEAPDGVRVGKVESVKSGFGEIVVYCKRFG